MKFDNDILYRWHNDFTITIAENELLHQKSNPFFLDDFNPSLNNEFLTTLSSYNLSNDYKLSVDKSATAIIDFLFEKYVTDDTLVITTGFEHTSALNNIIKCKNVFQICNHSKLLSLIHI